MTPETKRTPADLVIFAVKFNALDDAIKAASNQIDENTIILSALNGISSGMLLVWIKFYIVLLKEWIQ